MHFLDSESAAAPIRATAFIYGRKRQLMGGNGFCRKSRISLGKRQGEREKRGTPKNLQGPKVIVGKIGHH